MHQPARLTLTLHMSLTRLKHTMVGWVVGWQQLRLLTLSVSIHCSNILVTTLFIPTSLVIIARYLFMGDIAQHTLWHSKYLISHHITSNLIVGEILPSEKCAQKNEGSVRARQKHQPPQQHKSNPFITPWRGPVCNCARNQKGRAQEKKYDCCQRRLGGGKIGPDSSRDWSPVALAPPHPTGRFYIHVCRYTLSYRHRSRVNNISNVVCVQPQQRYGAVHWVWQKRCFNNSSVMWLPAKGEQKDNKKANTCMKAFPVDFRMKDALLES